MYEKLLLFRDYYYTYSHSLQVLGSGRVDCYTFIIRVLGLSTTYLYILLVLYLVGILKEKWKPFLYYSVNLDFIDNFYLSEFFFLFTGKAA